MRVILFGSGGYLNDRIDVISSLPETEVVGITDSNQAQFGRVIMGTTVQSFESVSNENNYDYVVIASSYAVEIKSKLLALGVPEKKIKRLREYEGLINRENIVYIKTQFNTTNKTILAVTPILDYNGACLAIVYALEELHKRYGYNVTIASPKYTPNAVEYISNRGISIIIRPNIEFESIDESKWAMDFDYIIINTLIMRRCLARFDPIKTIWWIHEPEEFYSEEIRLWGDFANPIYKNYCTFCVSTTARDVFEKYFGPTGSNVLECAIPDRFDGFCNNLREKSKWVIAVVGFVNRIKGQDILIDAIKRIPLSYRSKFEVWFIGEVSDDCYKEMLSDFEQNYDAVVHGAVSQDRLETLYQSIDIVVVPSRQETMSIATVEGLMHKKICILSNAAGIVQYLHHNEDAYIFKSEDIDDLSLRIIHVLDHPDEAVKVAKNGRKRYEEIFLPEYVAKRIDCSLKMLGAGTLND